MTVEDRIDALNIIMKLYDLNAEVRPIIDAFVLENSGFRTFPHIPVVTIYETIEEVEQIVHEAIQNREANRE